MEDIRFNQKKNNVFLLWVLNFLRKNWGKIILVIVLVLIIIFPTIVGGLIGTWLSLLVKAFTKNYVLMVCL